MLNNIYKDNRNRLEEISQRYNNSIVPLSKEELKTKEIIKEPTKEVEFEEVQKTEELTTNVEIAEKQIKDEVVEEVFEEEIIEEVIMKIIKTTKANYKNIDLTDLHIKVAIEAASLLNENEYSNLVNYLNNELNNLHTQSNHFEGPNMTVGGRVA